MIPEPEKHVEARTGGDRDASTQARTLAGPKVGDGLEDGTGEFTELANAERMIARHGAEMMFVRELAGWLCWDGRRWRADPARAMRYAKDTLRQLAIECGAKIAKQTKTIADADESGDDETRERAQRRRGYDQACLKWAERSQSASGLAAMLKLAESAPTIVRRAEELDADPWLFSCQSGTIDLRTGVLGPHERQHRITKISPVAYDPDVDIAPWLDFLRVATSKDGATADDATIAFLQQCAGYSLTGSTAEEKFFIAYGPKGSGKSTFVEAMRTPLGDYARATSFDTFVARKDAASQRPDLARLAGARMVSASELAKGRRISDDTIDNITGGEVVQACHKYRDPFEFKPQFKLWWLVNVLPSQQDPESGFWRRVVVIPFEFAVPAERRDPKLKAMLTDPMRGGPMVLRWMVLGCLAWEAAGRLIEPVRVASATDGYRTSQDPIAGFVRECCKLDAGAFVLKADLLASYRQWVKDRGEPSIPADDLTAILKAPPYSCTERNKRVAGGTPRMAWFGIRARTASDDAADDLATARAAELAPVEAESLHAAESVGG